MIVKKNYSGNCWWCTDIANSREHKIKRTDFVKVFGKGPYPTNNRPILVKNGKEIPIQSSKSNFIKFSNCMCQKCNNERSSEFDKAYAKFMIYVREKQALIYRNLFIDFRAIFGKNWKIGKRNTFKYWVKHIACQAATGNYEVSENLINFLNDKENLFDVNFLFQFREYNLLLSELMKKSGSNYEQTYIGKTHFFKKRTDPLNVVETITGWYTLNWFSINYGYKVNIIQNLYKNQNPLDHPQIMLRLVKSTDLPSLINITTNKQIFEKIEDFDRGESFEKAVEFMNKIQNEKNTITKFN